MRVFSSNFRNGVSITRETASKHDRALLELLYCDSLPPI